MKPDVLIVGGGVIGCSAAYHLAREGLSVLLLERDDVAAHASGAAAGMLAPIGEAAEEGAFLEAGLRSLARIPALAAELRELGGIDPQYVPSGILRVALSAEEAHRLRERAARLAAWGVEWLDPEAARAREPAVSPEVRGALWSPREGHVYSPAFTRAYAAAAARLGVRIETGIPVVGLLRCGSRVVGVRTPAGEREAGCLLLCTGAWTRFSAEWAGTPLPVAPVRGQIAALEAPRPPFHPILWSEEAYLVSKRDGSLIVGATEERVGFDCRTTAAAIARLLTAACRLAPALGEVPLRQVWAGLRPETPDHLPAIGPLPGAEGLFVAAGHFRNGVLLSPVTGELVADWILGRPRPAFADAFLPARLLSA